MQGRGCPMTSLRIRHQQMVADPLQSERMFKALTIILEQLGGARMHVAFYARVSTSQQPHEGMIESQRRLLQQHIRHQSWDLLPVHEYLDDGVSGARLDRPGLDRLRNTARHGEFDAV